jgi:hypothetical protein
MRTIRSFGFIVGVGATLGVLVMACGGSHDDGESGAADLSGRARTANAPTSTPDAGAPDTADAAVPDAAASSANGWVGLYENEAQIDNEDVSTRLAWAIRVTSESPFTFHLVAGNLEDSSERVDANDLIATASGDKYVLEGVGADCTIELTKRSSAISVTQTGKCTDLGFPDSGDLEMSDSSTAGRMTDFRRLDETKECFDTQLLAISRGQCNSPL